MTPDASPSASIRDAGANAAAPPTSAVTNIQAIIDLERETRRERTVLERVTDRVSAAASNRGFITFHLVWFALWTGLNTLSTWRFDPFPFSLLTLFVALEGIVLTGFVLMSQSRMTQLADKRAHLDLQVNLLAEHELTAILRVVCLVAEKIGVELKGADPHLDQLLRKTDVKALAQEITRELATVDEEPIAPSPRETILNK